MDNWKDKDAMITSSICEYSVEQGPAVLAVGALWQLLAGVVGWSEGAG